MSVVFLRSMKSIFSMGCMAISLMAGMEQRAEAEESIIPPLIEKFKGTLSSEWKWVREDKAGWKLTSEGLAILVEPGNMWGSANDAKNLLLRSLPKRWHDRCMVEMKLSHKPKKRWEQANLVWYYSDSAMVKIGLEIENGKTNIVMGREENDKTQTIAVIPYNDNEVELRFLVKEGKISGDYRPEGKLWMSCGETSLPIPSDGSSTPQISLQCYQGEADSNRWAVFHWLRVSSL